MEMVFMPLKASTDSELVVHSIKTNQSDSGLVVGSMKTNQSAAAIEKNGLNRINNPELSDMISRIELARFITGREQRLLSAGMPLQHVQSVSTTSTMASTSIFTGNKATIPQKYCAAHCSSSWNRAFKDRVHIYDHSK